MKGTELFAEALASLAEVQRTMETVQSRCNYAIEYAEGNEENAAIIGGLVGQLIAIKKDIEKCL